MDPTKGLSVRVQLDQTAVIEAVVEFGLRVGDSRGVRMALLRGQVVVYLLVVILLLGIDGDQQVSRLGHVAVCRDVVNVGGL